MHNFLGFRPQVRNKIVDVLVDFDVYFSVQNADLNRLIDKLSWNPNANNVKELSNILRIHADASVSDKTPNGPRVIGVMNFVEREGKIDAVFPHRIVRRIRGNKFFAPSFLFDPFLFDGVGNDPSWIESFPRHFELCLRRGPVFTSETNRKCNDYAIAQSLL